MNVVNVHTDLCIFALLKKIEKHWNGRHKKIDVEIKPGLESGDVSSLIL